MFDGTVPFGMMFPLGLYDLQYKITGDFESARKTLPVNFRCRNGTPGYKIACTLAFNTLYVCIRHTTLWAV
jgi:hypothetical protein